MSKMATDQVTTATPSQAVSGSQAADFASLIMDNPDGDVFQTEHHLGAMVAKQEQMADEIAEKVSMVADPVPLSLLSSEYNDRDKKTHARIEQLCATYDSVRKVRPDGNAFYRAFAFAYTETLLDDIDELMNAQDIIRRAREDLVCLGYPVFTFEIFYDVFYHVLKSIRHGITRDDLYSFFNHPLVSDSIVAFLRLITAAHLQLDSEYYMRFYKWTKKDLESFCSKEVEPMHVEAEEIQMTALAARFGIATRVEYIGPQEVTELTWGKPVQRVRIFKDYLEGWDPRVFMLARPGQFDILYRAPGRGPYGNAGRFRMSHPQSLSISTPAGVESHNTISTALPPSGHGSASQRFADVSSAKTGLAASSTISKSQEPLGSTKTPSKAGSRDLTVGSSNVERSSSNKTPSGTSHVEEILEAALNKTPSKQQTPANSGSGALPRHDDAPLSFAADNSEPFTAATPTVIGEILQGSTGIISPDGVSKGKLEEESVNDE